MPQFPAGFQGASIPGFVAAAANFGNFRPQYSVPGQPSNTTFTGDQAAKTK